MGCPRRLQLLRLEVGEDDVQWATASLVWCVLVAPMLGARSRPAGWPTQASAICARNSVPAFDGGGHFDDPPVIRMVEVATDGVGLAAGRMFVPVPREPTARRDPQDDGYPGGRRTAAVSRSMHTLWAGGLTYSFEPDGATLATARLLV